MTRRQQIGFIAVAAASLSFGGGCTFVSPAMSPDIGDQSMQSYQALAGAPPRPATPVAVYTQNGPLSDQTADIISLSLVSAIGRNPPDSALTWPQQTLQWQDVSSQRLVYDSGGFSTFALQGENLVDAFGWSRSSALDELNGRLEARRLLQPYYDLDAESLNFNAAVDFAARAEQTGLNFDLGFTPRAGVRDEGDYRVRSIGAEFRLGRGFLKGFDRRGKRIENGGWYIFAGADGEAVIWNTGRDGISFGLPSTDSLSLQDKVTVGDIQAGITFERFGGEWSASYIRREVEYNDQSIQIERSEDFGGISFTIRR